MRSEHIIDNQTGKLPVKEYLEQKLQLSSRQAKKLLKEKKVVINGKTAYWDNTVKGGDRLVVDLTEEQKDDIKPEKMQLDILYEDDCLMAVNKPPYILMHPTKNHTTGTLANALKYYFMEKDIKSVIRFLNRLDMNTSGVVIVPKMADVHSALMQQMEAGSIEKKYIAIVEGTVKPEQGIVDEPIGFDPENPIKRAVIDSGSDALTKYSTILALQEATMLEVGIVTGRTHQIRVHMSHKGNPVIGDELYGKRSMHIARQALHAYSMSFIHPEKGERITIVAPVPEDMEQLIAALKQ